MPVKDGCDWMTEEGCRKTEEAREGQRSTEKVARGRRRTEVARDSGRVDTSRYFTSHKIGRSRAPYLRARTNEYQFSNRLTFASLLLEDGDYL